MLSRLVSICRPSLSLSRHHLSLPHFPSPSPSLPPSLPPLFTLRLFGTTTNGDGGNNNNDDTPSDSTLDAWKLSTENDDLGVFGTQEEEQGGSAAAADEGWEFNKPWSVGADNKEDVFGSLWESRGSVSAESLRGEETQKMEAADQVALLNEEERLTAILKGPNRAFGDLVAASGISDAMLDSLMALKNFDGITGLPPLTEIEDMRYQKSLKDLSKAEMERLKQEEIAKSRVRTVDEIGRAYGTGKRKCSIARVWLQPGAGKFVVNDKEFDVYFPMLDHRAALLRPFSETKTLGLWDVKCTVKGGGVSGQVGAVRLGVSKALQNWEPGLRPPLRQAGFFTRDSRVVERKKPGKAKARKSFQWVKR